MPVVSLIPFLLICPLVAETGFVGKNGRQLFDAALQRHVQDGLVDYEAMASDEDFSKYLGWLKNVNPDTLKSRPAKMAFWVNAYNALAIKSVINNFPLEKVIDIKGFFDKNKHPVAGQKYTLDQIEKEIIFPKFKEPKLHFLLVCAAMSCPPLPSQAYTAENIDSKMEAITREFLNDPIKNRLDREHKVLYLSKILEWYEKDFTANGGSVLQFIKPYLPEESQAFLQNNQVRIEFLEYDWSLNAQTSN